MQNRNPETCERSPERSGNPTRQTLLLGAVGTMTTTGQRVATVRHCGPKPILIVLAAVVLVATELAAVVVVPVGVAALVIGIPEPRPSRLPSVVTGQPVALGTAPNLKEPRP